MKRVTLVSVSAALILNIVLFCGFLSGPAPGVHANEGSRLTEWPFSTDVDPPSPPDSEPYFHGPEVCEIHGTKTTRTEVPISYGLPVYFDPPTKLEQARKRLFPNNEKFVEGGCCVMPERVVIVGICADCVSAEAEWKREHSK